ncbi:unnamed protein product [Dovyalis caffra]|uniref:Uncharacterized protein n=1 Tax=Dovyalis caffra TaxID=77055 RepID=A0AAV1S9R4_9ROSI|nr:unnamed protein product [Dovyalis caffra]
MSVPSEFKTPNTFPGTNYCLNGCICSSFVLVLDALPIKRDKNILSLQFLSSGMLVPSQLLMDKHLRTSPIDSDLRHIKPPMDPVIESTPSK